MLCIIVCHCSLLRGKTDFAVEDGLECLHHGTAGILWKWWIAKDESVNGNARAPCVRRKSISESQNNFRGNCFNMSTHGKGPQAGAKLAYKAKLCQDNISIIIELEMVQAYCTVHISTRMDMLHCRKDACSIEHNLRCFEFRMLLLRFS